MDNQSGRTHDEGYLTFIHRFSRSLQCVARIKDEPPEPGQSPLWIFEWTGRPKPKHVNAYRQWALSVNQLLCDRWRQSILYCLGVKPNETEVWIFKPGEAPKLLKKLNIGIP
jgi:hypothetical protein